MISQPNSLSSFRNDMREPPQTRDGAPVSRAGAGFDYEGESVPPSQERTSLKCMAILAWKGHG